MAEAVRKTKPRLGERYHASLALWATDCAEHVLPCFEEDYPEDDRPRRAVEAGRARARGGLKVGEGRAAARAADGEPARAAATAHTAAQAANYAIKAVTHAAASTSSAAAAAKERDRQHRRLSKQLRPVASPDRGDN